jgi:hypothetical protein
MNTDLNVDLLIIRALTNTLNDLCAACVDGESIKAPDRVTLMKARASLPPKYSMSLVKPKKR